MLAGELSTVVSPLCRFIFGTHEAFLAAMFEAYRKFFLQLTHGASPTRLLAASSPRLYFYLAVGCSLAHARLFAKWGMLQRKRR